MKNANKLLGFLAIVAVIWLSFAACNNPEQGPEGPQGSQGPQGDTGPAGSIRVIDRDGREVGILIMSSVMEDTKDLSDPTLPTVTILYAVTKKGYTFPIQEHYTLGYWMIWGVPTYFTEQQLGGNRYFSELMSKDITLFKNFITEQGSRYYRAKNRDAQGYAILGSGTVSFKSCGYGGLNVSNIWPTYSGTLHKAIEMEWANDVTTIDIFGFTPNSPLRLQY
jgi:hypothetical protein